MTIHPAGTWTIGAPMPKRPFGIQERRTGTQAAPRFPITQVTAVSRPRRLPIGSRYPLSYQHDTEEFIWVRYKVGLVRDHQGQFNLYG